MSSTSLPSAKDHDFSQAFEQMCSVVAIADTRNAEETLKQLILQCFIVGSDRRFYSSEQIRDQIQAVFGLSVPHHQVDGVFLRMIRDGSIDYVDKAHYVLPTHIRTELQARVNEATALEEKIKGEWLLEVAGTYPTLDGERIWTALREYLADAFGRHGLLTVALLDPSIDVSAEQDTSLSALLGGVVSTSFPLEQQADARVVISGFLNSVVDRPDRAKYIAQLADGAFNYYSLTVAPDVSARLREHLSTLTLFLDTNFLLGILDLHTHSLVEVSRQLLQDINKHKLPFKLRFHPATEEEMRATLDYYGRRLRSREWSPALSKVIIERITTISGIERKYHEMNAQRKTSVNAFLQPYERHSDVLLKEKNIDIYRSHLDEEDVSRLSYDYREFVAKKRNGREIKEDTTVRHDMILLDTVRQLRSNAKSSLQAGALLLTCDATLCRFDWANSRATNHAICTIMPDILWQMLRPFLIPDAAEDRASYDRAFAATFAIPEFRAIENSAAREKAKERLMNLLTQYRDVSEATATKLITNDLFLTQLESDMSDEEARLQLENELLHANTELLEEAAALSARLEVEEQEREKRSRQLEDARAAQQVAIEREQAVRAALEQTTSAQAALEQTTSAQQAMLQRQLEEERVAHQETILREREEARQALKRKDEESERQKQADEARRQAAEAQRQASDAENARQLAALNARLDEKEQEDKERHQQETARAEMLTNVVTATVLSAVLDVAFLLLVAQSTMPPFVFIRKHPHALGIQLAIIVIISCLVFAWRVKKWRVWCLIGGIASLGMGGLIQIL